MFFKTDADRASAQAAKARHDAGAAGNSAATGARNLGAAVLATLAEATAPKDDNKGRKHAQKARAKALKAATHDREATAKAASKAAEHGRKAADLGRAAADRRTAKASTAAQKKASTASRKASKAARVRAEHLAERTGPLRAGAKEKAGVSAAMLTALAAAARDKAEETRYRAALGVDQGIDAAVPRAQDGVAAVGPRVDHLRDVINEELLPKIQAMLGDVQANKERILTQEEGFAAAVTGTPKKRKKKGGVLIALGLLAAVGAAVAWWLGEQEKSPAKDPWASQAGGADPWASRTPATAAGTDAEVVATSTPTAAAAGASTTGTAGATTSPSAQSFGVGAAGAAGTAETAETTTGTTGAAPTSSGSIDDPPRMLDSEDIDELAADEPSTRDEQTPGESPTEEIRSAREHHDEPVAHDSGPEDDDSRAREEAEVREHADDATWSGTTDRPDEDDRAGVGTGPDVDAGPSQPPLDRPEEERRYDDRSSGI